VSALLIATKIEVEFILFPKRCLSIYSRK